jgi:hypothetical protein
MSPDSRGDEFVETANLGSALGRFTVDEHVCAPLGIDELRAEKLALIERIGSADSLRDFGGLWGVQGLYLLEGVRALRCSFAEMIDTNPVDEFSAKCQELQAERAVQINMLEADFRSPALFPILRPVDVALLYDVLLHQDTVASVVKGVTATTLRDVLVAQPLLKEDLFPLPNAAVNLQFYSEALKAELRSGTWWPEEEPVKRFDTSKWMWGQTPSYLESLFVGYGWRREHLQLNDLGRYWNYGFMHFVPDAAPE